MQSLPPNFLRSLPKEVLATNIGSQLSENDLASVRSTNLDFSNDPDLKTAQANVHVSTVIQVIFSDESTPAIITDLIGFQKNLAQAISNKSYTEMVAPINTLIESLTDEFWANHEPYAHNTQAMQDDHTRRNLIFVKFEILRQECWLAEVAKNASPEPSLLKNIVEKTEFLFSPRGIGMSFKELHPLQNIAVLFSSQPASMQLCIKEEQSNSLALSKLIESSIPLTNGFPANPIGQKGNKENKCVLF